MKITPRHASAILGTISCTTATYLSTSHKPVTMGDIRDALESVLDERTMLREALAAVLRGPAPDFDARDRAKAALELTKGDD